MDPLGDRGLEQATRGDWEDEEGEEEYLKALAQAAS
jgi:hypothetical protein